MATDGRAPFGSLLKRYRLAAGLTHERLAERAGISPRTISDLERGISQYPRPETLVLLADALRLTSVQRAILVDSAQPRKHTRARLTPPLAGSGLPIQLTNFFGREQEMQSLLRLLRRSGARLVTITGPGGVGKSRLAVEVMAEILETYEKDVAYVALAPVADRDGVIQAILRALGVPGPAGTAPMQVMLDALADRQIVLMLDNFEHLLDAAPLVIDLLRGCPGVTALVTSRAALRVSGEQELPLAPLEVPSAERLPPLEELAGYPSVALFVDRAARAHPAFQLSAGSASAVAAICARLDGLPLALELAAARMKLLTPRALLARLEDDTPGRALGVLSGGARDWPDRHQTLRDTVAWSYDLLSDDEQRLLRHLAVFASGCTIEAAETVCSLACQDRPVLDGLASLLDKSLIQQMDGADDEPRVGLLETIRQYALEQLIQHKEEPAARRRHAQYYLALVEATGGLLFAGAPQRNRGAAEQDNIQAALRWLVQHG